MFLTHRIRLTVACLLVVTPFARAQWPTTKVTLVCPGKRVEKLMPELAKVTGLPLFSSPTVNDDVLVLKVEDAQISDLLERIARVVGGSWKKEEGGWRLVRTSEERQAQEQREYLERVQRFTKLIEKQKEKLAKLSSNPANTETLIKKYKDVISKFNPDNRNFDWGDARKLQLNSPSGLALGRIKTLLDPRVLAQMPPEGRIVFSTNPTPTQLAMPDEMARAVQVALTESERWRNELRDRGISNPTRGGTTYILFDELWDRHDGMMEGQAKAKSATTIVTVVVSANRWSDTPQISINGFDAKGKQTFENAENGIYDDSSGERKEPANDPSEKEIDLGSEIFEPESSPGGMRKPTRATLAFLTDCVEHDPIGMATGPALIKLAEAKKANLIAMVDDNGFHLGNYRSKVKPSIFLYGITVSGYNVETDKGFLTIQPKKPARGRLERTNRKNLSSIIQKYRGRTNLNLEEQADVACSFPRQASLASSVLQMFGIQTPLEDTGLRVYGNLSPVQRQQAATAGLPYRLMSEGAKKEVYQAIYNAQWFNLQYDATKDPGFNPNAPNAWEKQSLFYNGIYKEPTFAVPDGVGQNALFKLVETSAPSIFRVSTDPQRSYLNNQPMSAEELGSHQYQMEHLDRFPWMKDQMEYNPPLSAVRYGSLRSVTMQLYFTPSVSMSWTIQQKNVPSDRIYKLNELPDEFMKAYKEAYKRQEEMYKNSPPPTIESGATTNGTP